MEYCLPIAVRGWQNAENIETLLQKKVLQIGLNEKELVKLSGGYGYINANGVVLRGGPNGSAVILGTFDIGTIVAIIGVENGWTEVYIDGVMGYVKSEYVTHGVSANVPIGPSSYTTDSGSSAAQVVIPDGGYDSVTVVTGNQNVNPNDTWNPNLGIMPD